MHALQEGIAAGVSGQEDCKMSKRSKRSFSRLSIVALSLTAALGATACAMAQTADSPANAPARVERFAGIAAERQAAREAMVEGHLAFLKTRLQITDAQTPLWNAYEDAVRATMAAREEARPAPPNSQGGQQAPPPTALERLNRQQQMLAAQTQHLQTLSSALQPLYAALSAEQREIADRILAAPARQRMAQMGPGQGPGMRGPMIERMRQRLRGRMPGPPPGPPGPQGQPENPT